MKRFDAITPTFVEFIPSSPDPGVLYISEKYKTATHLCCCGCGTKVVTPLKPGGWQVSVRKGAVNLSPSIGNWSFPCQSHYWIQANQILWAGQLSDVEIRAVRLRDQRDREAYFGASQPGPSWWQRVHGWIRRVFSR